VDPELYAALARARRLTARAADAPTTAPSAGLGAPDDRAALLLAQRLAARVEPEADAEMESKVDLSSLEFSETGEFCKAVRSREEADASSTLLPSAVYRRQKEEELKLGAVLGTASTRVQGGAQHGAEPRVKREAPETGPGDGPRVKTERPRVKTETPAEDEGEGAAAGSGAGASGAAEDDEEDEEEDEDEDEDEGGPEAGGAGFLYERAASGGMGAVLDLARNRGMLADEGITAGRTFDQKGAGLHQYDEAKEAGSFNLDHYDEYGRKMTQKQAFRQMSWKFHGKGPSKKNREKRMLEVEKQRVDLVEDKAMKYMSALQTAQRATKSAHVVLTGVHAIKASDLIRGGDKAKAKKPKLEH